MIRVMLWLTIALAIPAIAVWIIVYVFLNNFDIEEGFEIELEDDTE